ncbi:uncharacterized protein GGS22DRAFT_155770 [Annulohypoxylon maeteangense]|uniref:uncharacterized protein n=1 Tax=Annulohypoxylon maeteangense TaxID=1927788 RepID=UPI002007B83F|nr:uncharacterized protein GGS22DRAFT_155770 [Annulohypoxylon maeteangense]KAI0888401.1 hypothetical protein GGS22DRAFT_155770 [Annulohypoxylon maeteangense]
MAHMRVEDDLAYGESYGERWDRDRFVVERDRNRPGPEQRDRFEEHDRYFTRGPKGRVRETSVDERFERRPSRPWDDEPPLEKRYYDDPPRFRRSPPPEIEQRLVIDRERDREREREREFRHPSPPRRPGQLIRRQSSLDTFDRRPPPRFFEREEPEPIIRRADYRPEPHKPIPLPRSRALPPPRIYAERDLERDFEEIKISEPDRYGDDEYHAYPERVRELEIVKARRRRDSGNSRRVESLRSRSTASDDSSSSGGTTVTAKSMKSAKSIKSVKSEYPKKGKTRIPVRLVSKAALIDLGYPFVEEGNVLIVQKALGQQNIDDLLKLSEEYKKSELEIAAARSSAAGLVEERREEIFTLPPPPPPPPPIVAPPPPSIIHTAAPVAPSPPPPVEMVRETFIREASPTRSYRSHRSHSTSTTRTPVIMEPREREFSDEVAVGPLALISDRRRGDREIKMEIARLEAERDLLRPERRHHHHHSHSRHRSHSHSTERELVSAERLPTGELVLYEEQVERIEEPRRGVRIEKDKKGPPPSLMRAMLATLT